MAAVAAADRAVLQRRGAVFRRNRGRRPGHAHQPGAGGGLVRLRLEHAQARAERVVGHGHLVHARRRRRPSSRSPVRDPADIWRAAGLPAEQVPADGRSGLRMMIALALACWLSLMGYLVYVRKSSAAGHDPRRRAAPVLPFRPPILSGSRRLVVPTPAHPDLSGGMSMRAAPFTLVVALVCALALASLPGVQAQSPVTAPTAVAKAPAAATTASSPLYQRFLSPASPLDMAAAKKVDRVAWVAFEEGKRNAYTAVAPAFAPVRLTSFLNDDGIDMSAIQISDDGVHGDVRARHGAEPRRLGGQRLGRPERARARHLGREARSAGRRSASPNCRAAAINSRPTAARLSSCGTARSSARRSRR